MRNDRKESMRPVFTDILGILSLLVGVIGYLFFEFASALTILIVFVGLLIVSFLVWDLWGLFRSITQDEDQVKDMEDTERPRGAAHVPEKSLRR